jgi:hypothetical protein
MHVLHRPHLPRLISLSIVAALLAIAVSLALASGLNDISQPGNGTSMPAYHSPATPASALGTAVPQWARHPFASLSSRPLPLPWQTGRP